MDGMIFAAGLGTRLRPITDRMAKALVAVGGVAMLERTARRLVAAGCDRLVINVCPFADDIAAFVRARGGFGVEVAFSLEAPAPFETGGGLLAARGLLRRDGPCLLHNADVYTDLPLAPLLDAHAASGALATVAVMDRPTSRRLLFDAKGLLGRADDAKALRLTVRPAEGPVIELGFSGVHAVAPTLLDRITETGTFSILDTYLRLAREGAPILPFRADGCTWIDIGRNADLERAELHASRAAGAKVE